MSSPSTFVNPHKEHNFDQSHGNFTKIYSLKGIFSAQFCNIAHSQAFLSNNITEKHYSSQALVPHKQGKWEKGTKQSAPQLF